MGLSCCWTTGCLLSECHDGPGPEPENSWQAFDFQDCHCTQELWVVYYITWSPISKEPLAHQPSGDTAAYFAYKCHVCIFLHVLCIILYKNGICRDIAYFCIILHNCFADFCIFFMQIFEYFVFQHIIEITAYASCFMQIFAYYRIWMWMQNICIL